MAVTSHLKLVFEQEPCARCHGTGEHSYNQRDGKVCWGCAGKGTRMSPKGRRAFDAFEKALYASAGAVAVRDLKPGMVIRSEAHGGLTSSAVAYDLKPAWRTVAEVTIEERTFEHGGCADGFMIDVPGVRAEIKFEGGASWSAYSSDDPAYWHKDGSARRITGATRGFLIQSEEAADARDEVRRAIARRFSGAWLEGEEPTAPARPLKAAEVASAPPVRVVLTRSQLYPEVARPGPAWQWCYAYAIDGAPAITYGTGLASCRDMLRQKYRGRVVEFVEAWKAQVPRIEVATPDAQEGRRKRPGGPLPVNLYPGDCRDCGKPVGAGEGERLRVGGRWAVQHRDGECPA